MPHLCNQQKPIIKVTIEPKMKNASERMCLALAMAAVISDLNSRRGLIEDMDTVDEIVAIKAAVPLTTMLGYANHLKLLYPGLASSTIKFKQYEAAPNPPFDDDGPAPVRAK